MMMIPGNAMESGGSFPIETATIKQIQRESSSGFQNSSWPMYCHDTRHTGRSPYSTVDNSGNELWSFNTIGWAVGGPTIDENGTIYIGSYYLDAVYPNGTLKWRYLSDHGIYCAPAIDESGVIYFGDIYGDGYLYAIYPNGILKWRYYAGGDIFSSPAIGNGGVIYFGCGGGYPPIGAIIAVYPNGTLKWKYDTNHVVYSSPVIGPDGTIYCGCHDTYLYAINPDNGTLKWKYKTGDWLMASPSIADDGTIYIVSLDEFLYAIRPNGTLKWKTNVGSGTSPTIGQDGTIYCGGYGLYAINPINGSVKWIFDVQGTIEGGTPCNSVDGTIYLGTSTGGDIIAVNPDGTEKWRRHIGVYVDSPPAIGKDGTVYIGSDGAPGEGCLYAFGRGPLEAKADGPCYGFINHPVQFAGTATGGYKPYSWLWNFGDGHTSGEQNPTHTYANLGNYTVTLTVTDNTTNTSTDLTWAWIQETNTPPNIPTINGPPRGKPGVSYEYTFMSSDPEGTPVWYYIEWGDGTNSGWIGPYTSGHEIIVNHTWNKRGTYTIQAKAKDGYGAESGWGTLSVKMPINNNAVYSPLLQLLERFLERYPHAFPILRHLLG